MFIPNADAPLKVNALAAHVEQFGSCDVRPIAWRETETDVVIVFEDGRKLIFDQVEMYLEAPIVDKITLADGVDDAESSLAGKALAARKKKKGGA